MNHKHVETTVKGSSIAGICFSTANISRSIDIENNLTPIDGKRDKYVKKKKKKENTQGPMIDWTNKSRQGVRIGERDFRAEEDKVCG